MKKKMEATKKRKEADRLIAEITELQDSGSDDPIKRQAAANLLDEVARLESEVRG